MKKRNVLIILWVIYLLSYAAGALKYQIVNLHQYHLPSAIWFLLSIYQKASLPLLASFIFIFFWVNLRDGIRKKEKGDCYNQIMALTSVIVFVLTQVIFYLEDSKYHNYVYTKTGLKIGDMELLSTISFINAAVHLLLINKPIIGLIEKVGLKKVRSSQLDGIKLIIIFSILILATQSLVTFKNSSGYYNFTKQGYEMLLENYDVMMSLSTFVPQNGVIIVPVQDIKWPDLSNPPVLRYFVFPRTIVSSSYVIQNGVQEFSVVYFPELENKRGDRWPTFKEGNLISFDGSEFFKYDELEYINKESMPVVIKMRFSDYD